MTYPLPSSRSAYAREMVASLPFGGELRQGALERCGLGGVFDEGESFVASEFQYGFVAERIGDVKA